MGDVQVQALQGVDLDVQRGEFVCVVGPSGSGKSTLFYVLGGLTAPTSGTVKINGNDLFKMSDSERTKLRRKTIGIVFQKYNLLPSLTARGEQQRVAIARALVNHPAILLADEPTGNVDTKNSHAVMTVLKDLNQRLGQTILVITHDPEVAAYGHRILHMRDGRIETQS
jgi:putative ABC transport system ATP-binding protein